MLTETAHRPQINAKKKGLENPQVLKLDYSFGFSSIF